MTAGAGRSSFGFRRYRGRVLDLRKIRGLRDHEWWVRNTIQASGGVCCLSCHWVGHTNSLTPHRRARGLAELVCPKDGAAFVIFRLRRPEEPLRTDDWVVYGRNRA